MICNITHFLGKTNPNLLIELLIAFNDTFSKSLGLPTFK